MTDTSFGTTSSAADEHKIARGIAIGLPLVTLSASAAVGILVGPATSILVVAAGLLLGVIAILWGSLRVLSGDAPLSPELEALEMGSHDVDVLANRKKMLLRALKDLENEHRIGKMETEDYEQISSSYREELKAVLKRIDDSLAPTRRKAEDAARAHLKSVGLVEDGSRGDPPSPKGAQRRERGRSESDRVNCPSCNASNERDAKFCKECAGRLGGEKRADEHQEGGDSDEE